MDRIHHTISYLRYLIKARHFRGDGVHSPFVFYLINFVFREKNQYYAYERIERVRTSLLNDNTELPVTDLGTGSADKRSISAIAKRSLKNTKYSQLLFRLVNRSKPNTILELGTSLGITTMYLAAPNSKAACITVEGAPAICEKARALFEKNKFSNIESYCGNINEILPLLIKEKNAFDFVFFDANHTEEATMNYFEQCVEHLGKKSVFVFDDIYWSKGMTKAWKKIKKHPRVRVTIDIFDMGIIYFDEDLQKGDYTLRF